MTNYFQSKSLDIHLSGIFLPNLWGNFRLFNMDRDSETHSVACGFSPTIKPHTPAHARAVVKGLYPPPPRTKMGMFNSRIVETVNQYPLLV